MFELRVLTGLHRGAALPLSGDLWHIGCSEQADLALFDPGLRENHAQLIRTEQGFLLTPKQGIIADHEGQRQEQLELDSQGTPFSLAHIWLCIVSADTPWPDEDVEQDETDHFAPTQPEEPNEVAPLPQPEITEVPPDLQAEWQTTPSRRLPRWAIWVYCFLCLVLFLSLVSWAYEAKSHTEAHPVRISKPILDNGNEARQAVSAMLLERALDQRVALVVDKNGLTLTGSVNAEDKLRVSRLLHQLREHYNVLIPVHNRTRLQTDKLPFTIVQITTGPTANIVTGDGRRIFVGDEVNHLRLISVTDNGILFAGNDQIKVNW